jgi:hypothetical protein
MPLSLAVLPLRLIPVVDGFWVWTPFSHRWALSPTTPRLRRARRLFKGNYKQLLIPGVGVRRSLPSRKAWINEGWTNHLKLRLRGLRLRGASPLFKGNSYIY